MEPEECEQDERAKKNSPEGEFGRDKKGIRPKKFDLRLRIHQRFGREGQKKNRL